MSRFGRQPALSKLSHTNNLPLHPSSSIHMKAKVIVTGASGVLGTAVYDAFKAADYPVLGVAHSRATKELVALDLLDFKAVDSVFKDFAPNCEHSLKLMDSTKAND